jgi:N-ethylmaleimide reductase
MFMTDLFSPKQVGANDRASAATMVVSGDGDLFDFGRHFTSNPDLPYRLKHKLPLTPYVRAAFWGGTERHYSDFPTYEAGTGT